MKHTWLSIQELAQELGISADSMHRAFQKGEIPGALMARTFRFDLGQVCRAMEERAKAMPNNECSQQGATGGVHSRIAPGW